MKRAFVLLLVFLVCSSFGLEYFYCHPSVTEIEDEHFSSTLSAVYIDGILRGDFYTQRKKINKICDSSPSKLEYHFKLYHKNAIVKVVKDSALFGYKQEKNYCQSNVFYDFFEIPLSSEELKAIRKDGEKATDKDFELDETETKKCLDFR